ncbi:MAG TPA: histidine kinase, partial [Magnetospirillaceae bacterium]|nr:histidine kinase [Magnetospirillaceae bacterium]
LTVWQAHDAVMRELGAALASGRREIETALDALPPGSDPGDALRRQIVAFNGNRHLGASLFDGDGRPMSISLPAAPSARVPGWFVRAVSGDPTILRIDLPPGEYRARTVLLEGDPRNEALEAWNSLRDMVLVILALSLSASLLTWWSTGRALRPLDKLAAALQSVGEGEFAARLDKAGPPELRVIAEAFNRMAGDLDLARERNRLLHRQLLTAQETERAEIARDLHDDIGPLLFAITIDAAAAENGAIREDRPGTLEAAQGIRATVQQAHARIRAIINRLRPVGLAEFGIESAVENLVDFWRRRHPEVQFTLDLERPGTAVGELVDVTAFRVIQEAVSNALQHGRPSHIVVTMKPEGEPGAALLLTIVDDGRGDASVTPGFGLTGMRDRIEAVGGSLTITAGQGQGFRVAASLPIPLGEARP